MISKDQFLKQTKNNKFKSLKNDKLQVENCYDKYQKTHEEKKSCRCYTEYSPTPDLEEQAAQSE